MYTNAQFYCPSTSTILDFIEFINKCLEQLNNNSNIYHTNDVQKTLMHTHTRREKKRIDIIYSCPFLWVELKTEENMKK